MSKAIHASTLEPILAFHQVSKTFPGMRALDKVSFQVREGEVVSLVGENGAGKSTLMKVLSGVWPQGTYEGEVRLRGVPTFFNNTKEAMAAGIAMIHQELSLFPELTIGEHLELDQLPYWINWKQLFQRTQEFLDKLGFDLSSKSRVCDLSIGGKQLVEVARALYRKAKILVFDEPTSALTENEVIKLYEIIQKLRQENRAIIYITHKMNEVFHLADRIIVLRDGQKVGEIQRLQNGKLLSRSEIEPRLITLMVGRPIQDIYPLKNQNFGSELLRVENLSLQTNHGEKLVDNFSFSLRGGEILGLGGLLGAGRSETLEALFGAFHGTGTRGNKYKCSGYLWIKNQRKNLSTPKNSIQLRMALATEDRKESGLILNQSVFDNITLPALSTQRNKICQSAWIFSFVRERKSNEMVTQLLQRLQIKTTHTNQLVSHLSGGNQQKVVLSKWLLTQPEILLLDEPTRGIDVGAKTEIYHLIQKLASYGMGIVLASSEMPELLGLCHRVLVLKEGKKSREFSHENLTQEDIMRAAAL